MLNLEPDESALVGRIHEEIATEPWFKRTAVTEWELLKLILANRRRCDDGSLRGLSKRQARGRFQCR